MFIIKNGKAAELEYKVHSGIVSTLRKALLRIHATKKGKSERIFILTVFKGYIFKRRNIAKRIAIRNNFSVT